MKSFLDAAEIEIECPNCQRKLKQKIGRLRGHTKVTCTGCSTAIAVDGSKLDQQVRAVDRQLGDLGKQLSKTIKIKL